MSIELETLIRIKDEIRSLCGICKDLNLNYSNIISGRSSNKNIEKVYNEYLKEIVKLNNLVLEMRSKNG